MSDIKLFRMQDGQATELHGNASDLERPLQSLIEANLGTLLGIRFLATEYSTGKTHGGRIDTLGIDENNCPVILEYKRSVGENVINQGLFYLDWLMDHRAEFKLLVLDTLDKPAADAIDWSEPRLVCIAADFTKYDGHAVQQINRNIELIRYRQFGQALLLFELVNAASAASPWSTPGKVIKATRATKETRELPLQVGKPVGPDRSFADLAMSLPEPMAQLLASLEGYTLSLGDDVQRKELRLYTAYKRLKNFATVVLQKNRLLLYLHLPPASVMAALPGARDVSAMGHWGTGDVEISLTGPEDLDAAKPFIHAAYEGRAPGAKV